MYGVVAKLLAYGKKNWANYVNIAYRTILKCVCCLTAGAISMIILLKQCSNSNW